MLRMKGSGIKEKVDPWEHIKEAINENTKLMTASALIGETIKLDYVYANLSLGFK